MQFSRQIWALVKKDLLILAVRGWISTTIRALIWPIVFTIVLVNIRAWTADNGSYGVGDPVPLKSFSDALQETGSIRPRIVIINNGITDGDIGAVVDDLSATIKKSGKELHVVRSYEDLTHLCPSSTAAVSPCYGAVQFYSSPQHGNADWNFTYYEDRALGGSVSFVSNSNDLQLYTFPFIHAITESIAKTQNGTSLRRITQFPYTTRTAERVQKQSKDEWQALVITIMGFAFFVAFCGICYHLTSYVTLERERGILGLMDAMMPGQNRYYPIIIRMIATHISFDLIYLPSWIVIGGVLSISFPNTNTGWLVLTSILLGLSLTSFSVLASSLFRRPQLAAISTVVLSLALALAAQFGLSPFTRGVVIGAVLITALLFPPCAFVYILDNIALFEMNSSTMFNPNSAPVSQNGFPLTWKLPTAIFWVFLVVQILVFPVLAVFIEKTLWVTKSKARHLKSSEAMGQAAVKLDGFSKHYKSLVDKKQTIKAVDRLSFNLHRGSITVLLGHNGSGKSTTLNSIAGLETVTSGAIEVDGTGGIGICPQKNIMWDSLTVEEHIAIFDILKSPLPKTKLQHSLDVAKLVDGCDLTLKAKAKSKTLSGGQKRKLQLAMMFAGGSRVCCIDEASSGIDPIARRKIWDILLAERGHRSMLLTTHFLDEADVLSDHVIIMSKGEMRAEGSVAALKHRHGGGYRVMVPGDISIPDIPDVTRSSDYTFTIFQTTDQPALARLITSLEVSAVQNYRIQGPTIENVFLDLIDEVDESAVAAEFQLSEGVEERLIELHSGRTQNYFKQTSVLLKKRLMILRHNYMPYVCALFASLVVAGLVTKCLTVSDFSKKNPDGIQCKYAEANLNTVYLERLSDHTFTEGIYGPPSLNSTMKRLIPPCWDNYCDTDSPANLSNLNTTDSADDFVNKIKTNSIHNYEGGFFVDSNSALFAWNADGQGEALTFALLNAILLNQTLVASYENFATSYIPIDTAPTLLSVFTALGFAIYPCLFALYPTAERLRNVRAMQYSNGILPSSLWTAHALFDLVFVLLISVLSTVIWATQWQGWYGLGYMFVVFFLYGLASTAFSYVVSLMVKSQTAALSATLVIQVLVSMLFFVSYLIVGSQAPIEVVYTWYNYIYFTIGIISPAVHLLRALFMVTNNYSLACRGLTKSSYPGEITIYGGPILYLILQFIILLVLLIWWESGSLEVFGIKKKSQAPLPALQQNNDGDNQRLADTNTGLRVIGASKTFGKHRAVDNVSLGILPGEKFALTGINGAGKTTLISLIRGDLKGSGSYFINGHLLSTSPMQAKSHLGVCPQFDAQDSLTVTEHLAFYADARGVPDKEHNIKLLIHQLGLAPHAKKLARKLSGGNMRKLSLAIALIANPSVLLLDEPSSGMDPAAKRALWRTLSAISAGRSLLITTHSMEEADALCDRAGVMAGKLLAVGSMEDLRAQHGAAACVHLVHKDAPHSRPEDVQEMREFVLTTFPGAALEMRFFGGQLRFSIPKTNLTLGQLYKLIHDRQSELGIVDYSVGPTNLDDVFLNVMREHGVHEEGTDEKDSKWYNM